MPKPSQAVTPVVLGDLSEDEFRAALYQAAEWSINYRSRIEERTISSDVKPGDVIANLPPEIPTLPLSMKDIIADFARLILPGSGSLGASRFSRILWLNHDVPGHRR